MKWPILVTLPLALAVLLAVVFNPRVWFATNPFFLIDLIGVNKFVFWIGNWAAFWLSLGSLAMLALALRTTRHPVAFGIAAAIACGVLAVQAAEGMPAMHNLRRWKSGALGIRAFVDGVSAEHRARRGLEAALVPFTGVWTAGAVRWTISDKAIERWEGNDAAIWMTHSIVSGSATARFPAPGIMEVEDALARAKLTVAGDQLTAEFRGATEVLHRQR